MIRQRMMLSVAILSLAALGVGCLPIAIDFSGSKTLLDPHSGTVAQIISLLERSNGTDALELLDELHSSVIAARALLVGQRFAGDRDTLTDPFTLPSGTYRVTMHGSGSPWVRAIPVADPDDDDYIMIGADDGSSVHYISDGERIMLEFSVVRGPYELIFERIE